MPVTPDDIKRFAPTLRFHPDEKFFPCSIEYLLQDSIFFYGSSTKANPSQQDLIDLTANLDATGKELAYVLVNSSQYQGQGLDAGGKIAAPVYVAVQDFSNYSEINYLILYAAQGGQTCRALRAGTEFDFISNDYGKHQGDLERVCVRITKDSSNTWQLLHVGYEADGDMLWYPGGRFTILPGQPNNPIVHVALNGHGSWNFFHVGGRVVLDEVPGIVAVTSNLSDQGFQWNLADATIITVGLDQSGNPTNALQPWSAFKGRLGVAQTNALTGATHFDGSGLSDLDWEFVRENDKIGTRWGKIPEKARYGNGATGLGTRSYMMPPAADQAIGLCQFHVQEPVLGLATGPYLALAAGDFSVDGQGDLVHCLPFGTNDSSMTITLVCADQATGALSLSNQSVFSEVPAAVAWLTDDFDGDGKAELVQVSNVLSWVAFNMFKPDSSGAWTRGANVTSSLQAASFWLSGDFDNDGKAEIAQVFGGGTALGLVVYKLNSGKIDSNCSNSSLTQMAGGLAWLAGNFMGDGRARLAQCAIGSNAVSMAITLYGLSNNVLSEEQQSDNIPSSVAVSNFQWLTGDVDDDGKTEIVQLCWMVAPGESVTVTAVAFGQNAGGTAMAVEAAGTFTAPVGPGTGRFSVPIVPIGAVVADIDGDHRDEIVWCLSVWGRLGFVVFDQDAGSTTLTSTWVPIGEYIGAALEDLSAWRVLLRPNGNPLLAQLTNSNKSLNSIIYTSL